MAVCTAGLRTSFNPGRPQDGYAIHVKGKSGLKQTRVTLDCWAKHPEWPPLVVVGKASDKELTPPSRSAGNIMYFPPITPPGQGSASSEMEMLIDAARLRDMQGAAFMHVCPSVREGFGHYLNEARAVGALVVTVDHPPMNELVRPQHGLLVPTVFTKSEPGTELGPLTNLNGHVSAEGLCDIVAKGLALSEQDKQQKRAAARAAFRGEKAAFLHRMQQLKRFLQARQRQQRQQWRQQRRL
jgi:glycosyltransferase involved in cell wall biosynthesis